MWEWFPFPYFILWNYRGHLGNTHTDEIYRKEDINEEKGGRKEQKGKMGVWYVSLISLPAAFYFAMESAKELESLFASFYLPTKVLV